MNQRDLAALKRRLTPQNRSPEMIRGLYVTAEGQVLSSFEKPVATLPAEEYETYAALFRKVLSGTQGQNLLPVGFAAAATMEDEAHQLLMRLVETRLQDEDAVQALYGRVLQSLHAESEGLAQSVMALQAADNQLVLLLYDRMDAGRGHRHRDEEAEDRDSVFSYVLCAVCPVRAGKPALRWVAQENDFHARPEDGTVAAPEMGFLFPSLENGGADIYNAQFFTRSADDAHEAFVQQVFGQESLTPAAEQQQTLQTVLAASLEEECSVSVLQAVHEQVSDMLREQKDDKLADPLQLSRHDLKDVLAEAGVSQDKVEAFDREFTETFGPHTEIPAVNVISAKQYKLSTPDVSITVNPARADLVQTRVIDGIPYILIQADGGVELNGINVHIDQE